SDMVVTRTPLLGMVAFRQAVEQSGLTDAVRTAFVNGTTVGGMEKSEQYYLEFFEGKHTEYIAAHDCGAGTEQIGRLFGHLDAMYTISTACSSATNALIMGANLIRSGKADAAIVGGTESLSKFHLNGFNSLMILDHEPCKPFDKNRNGLNLGEGAAYLVIETAESARKRGATPLCELSGYANACDAFHQTATSPDGEGPFLAMTGALNRAGLKPADIDYINAHGTGTGNNDLCESVAIKRVFGDRVPPFSSTKSFTGHTTSAAGAVEAVISILSLTNGFIPANLNFSSAIEESGLTPVTKGLSDVDLRHVMSNSFGFGGNDSSCIFSKIS
ncbi:MAG: beta-ketoacyl-[Paludibacteraceae bacterium]|nr:beta-ketoacyl-[acyl-carrier-protein] synthase family protein [Paludibacteraceae bacterium]